MKRRQMIHQSAIMMGGVCLCNHVFGLDDNISSCCFTPDIEPESISVKDDIISIDLNIAKTLSENGNAAYLDIKEKDVRLIVIHKSKKRYYALSRHCTHGNQALSYVKERKMLQCNSFNHSIFELNGNVWKGPAPEPIKSYEIELSDGKLRIQL